MKVQGLVDEVRGDGDVATRLHQEGSYTMLNRRLTSQGSVASASAENDKPRVIRRLWGEEGILYYVEARSRVARNAGRADRREGLLGL